MAKKKQLFLWIALIAFMLLFVSGCIEVALEFAFEPDGSGQAKITYTAADPMYNDFIQEMMDDMEQDPQPGTKVSSTMVDGKKALIMEVSFSSTSELDELDLGITYTIRDGVHRFELPPPGEDEMPMPIPISLSVSMPGKIIDSNGNVSGSTVTWPSGPMTQTYWVESEEGGLAAGGLLTYLLIATGVVALILVILIIFMIKGKKKQPAYSGAYGQYSPGPGYTPVPGSGYAPGPPPAQASQQGPGCSNCGNPLGPNDTFCSVCGTQK